MKCYVKRLPNLKQCCIFSPNNQHLIVFKWTTSQDHCCFLFVYLGFEIFERWYCCGTGHYFDFTPICRCEHEKCKSADACIMEVVGGKNSEHFFVASQDTDLRKKLQEVCYVYKILYIFNVDSNG